MKMASIVVPAGSVDEVAGRCWLAGAGGIVESPVGDGQVELRVGVTVEVWPGFLAEVADLSPADVTDRDAYRPGTTAVTIPVGTRALVLEVPDDVFGNGDHPTTAGCIRALRDLVRPATTVLDVGCGSGVLALVAAELGAAVTAVDIDPAAVEATTRNAEANGLGVTVSLMPLAEAVPHDVVVANLSAGTIVTLADDLVRVSGGGTLVVSGVLDHQWPAVQDALGLAVVELATEDGWVTATCAGSQPEIRPAGS